MWGPCPLWALPCQYDTRSYIPISSKVIKQENELKRPEVKAAGKLR